MGRAQKEHIHLAVIMFSFSEKYQLHHFVVGASTKQA